MRPPRTTTAIRFAPDAGHTTKTLGAVPLLPSSPTCDHCKQLANEIMVTLITPTVAVIRSVGAQSDGRDWAHVSMSRRDGKLPSWSDLGEVKELFIGDCEAYAVFPPRVRYVNEHPGVLHLWACMDALDGVLPDFTQGSGSV